MNVSLQWVQSLESRANFLHFWICIDEDCTYLSAVCQRYFRVDTLRNFFVITDFRRIIAFIKDINFYHHI